MILLVVLVIIVSQNFGEIINGPVDGTYAPGSNILLKCIATHDNHNIIWEDVGENKNIFIGRVKTTAKPKYANFKISSVEGNYSLIINNASISDEGEYSCQSGDQHINAVITIEAKPIIALFLNDTSNFNQEQYTITVGDTVAVTCRVMNSKENVSLELRFGHKNWITPTLRKWQRKRSYFDISITHIHTISRTDNPFSCRTRGLPMTLQTEQLVNILHVPRCSVIQSRNDVLCSCEANPPIYNYSIFVNGEKKSTNESLALSEYAPANFSCSAVNAVGRGYSSSRFISNASVVILIMILSGMSVCFPLLVYVFVTRSRNTRGRQMTPSNLYATSSETLSNPDDNNESGYLAPDKKKRVTSGSEQSEGIYASVYVNTPKEKFVKLADIHFERHLGESRYIERWTGKLHSSKEVIITSPEADLSPMAQISWVAFVKSLLDLPKTAYIVRVEGICVETGRFYLLQQYVPQGTLREVLLSIMYKSIKRNEDITSTSSVLLQLASSLVHGIDFIQRHNFYHPGLSSDEVIVFNNTTCKLYDFCSADFIQDKIDDVIKEGKNKVETRTLPPEAVFKRVYDKASEMWSLSATLWEIFTHGQKVNFNYLKDLSQQEPLEGECTLKKPPSLDNDIYKLMTKCWSKQPTYRPNISKLMQKIDEKITPRNCKRVIDETPQGYELMTVGAKND